MAIRRSPKHKSPRHQQIVQIIFVALFILMFIGTGLAAYFAYKTSRVELALEGEKTFDFSKEGNFTEPGFYARHCVFNRCRDLTDKVEVEITNAEKLQNREIGDYSISYRLDYLGETYTDSREVFIGDLTPPELTLNGPANVGLYMGETYTEPGFTATDNHDGDLTAKVVVESTLDTNAFGVYTLKYTVKDAAGNSAEATRRVFVYDWAAFSSEPIATLDDLRDYITRNGWDISFGFKNFEKGVEYTYRGDDLYYGASLVKTIDAMYAYETYGGNNGLTGLIRNTITYSNNSAHMSLAGTLGLDNLRTYAQNIGMTHHLQGSVYYGDTAYFCDTTVNDQMAEWTHLWELINNPVYGEELKWYFINNYWDNLSFPSGPLHMYKNGLYGNNYHESGIMFANSPFFMTFLSTEGWRWNMTYIMRDLAERTYLINETL